MAQWAQAVLALEKGRLKTQSCPEIPTCQRLCLPLADPPRPDDIKWLNKEAPRC